MLTVLWRTKSTVSFLLEDKHVENEQKKCPHVVHFNVPRDRFETNSRHQKRYSEGGKKTRVSRSTGKSNIWSRVPETALPPSYPGQGNVSLISFQNSTNRLHWECELASGGELSHLSSAGRQAGQLFFI